MKITLFMAFRGLLVIILWKLYFSLDTIIRPLVMGSVATPNKLSNTAESFYTPELMEGVFNNAIWIALIITVIILWKEAKLLVTWIKKNI